MNISASSSLYKHHHCPVEINRHGIWLYSRFCLSSRDVEALFFGRGMIMTDEAIRSPLNQPGNGRDVCSGASRPSTCSVFSPHMGLVPTPRQVMAQRFQSWHEVMGTSAAAGAYTDEGIRLLA